MTRITTCRALSRIFEIWRARKSRGAFRSGAIERRLYSKEQPPTHMGASVPKGENLFLILDVPDQSVHRAGAMIAAQAAGALGVSLAKRLENREMLQFGLFYFTGQM